MAFCLTVSTNAMQEKRRGEESLPGSPGPSFRQQCPYQAAKCFAAARIRRLEFR